MSAATIDRALQPQRERCSPRRRRPETISTIRRSIPVRTFSDWRDPPPGFVEADLVAHSGPVTRGSFVQTLVVTDIASGWTELAPLLVREQTLLVDVLGEIRRRLPFPLLGFDTDNDTVFMNETVRDYCAAEKIELTRCRPYRKNDQAHVEQKNGEIVRRMVGYRRYEGIAAAEQLARLYAPARLFVNAFQPSFKLAEEDARRRAREEALSQAADAVRSAADRCTRRQDVARAHRHASRRSRSGPTAGRDPQRPAERWSRSPTRRTNAHRRVEIGADSAARQLRLGPAHRVAGRRGSPDVAAEAESKAWPASPGPACRRDG